MGIGETRLTREGEGGGERTCGKENYGVKGKRKGGREKREGGESVEEGRRKGEGKKGGRGNRGINEVGEKG